MPATRPSRLLVVLAFAAVYILWGSTYLGIRLAIETLPPFLMAGTRFTLAGAILLAWSRFKKGEPFVSTLNQWQKALLVGGLLLLCGNGGVTWAEKYVATGLAALLVSTEPLWVVILNWILTRRRPNWKVLLGVLIGLAGVAMLVGDGLSLGNGNSRLSLIGGVVVIVAALGWATGSVFTNRHPLGASTSMTSGMQMFCGGALLLLLALGAGDFGRLNLGNASWTSIGAFFYLLIFGSLVGFTAYSWLLNNVTPAMATTYAYVNPVVAVFLGWLIAGEPLTRRMLVAATVIISSVVLITTFSREPEAAIHDSKCPTPPCA